MDEAARLLSGLPAALPDRLERISRALLGRPYVVGPLDGPGPERLVARLDAFDCVTFVESVFALARCRGPAEWREELRLLRYLRGRVRWRDRNHYVAAQWIRRNARDGRVRLASRAPDAVPVGPTRALTALPRLRPPPRWTPRCLPVCRLDRLPRIARPGDLVGFVSTRPDLDLFHVGLLFGDRLRHASRSRGGVVEEPLADFLARNETPGLVLARLRPRPGPPGPSPSGRGPG